MAHRPVRWLHLSDLHLGCRGGELWWQVHEELEASIREQVARLGVPDLVLFTGDLSFSGAEEQFDGVDRFLDALLGWIREAGGGDEPLIVPVPGNHDLARPQGFAALPYRVLEKYPIGAEDEDVRLVEKALWEKKDASFIASLFQAYEAWFERRIQPELESRCTAFHRSHFPGDYCLEVEIPGTFPLAIVGLNSTWQQYKGGDFERRLVIPARQFHAALSSDDQASPLATFKRCPRALLLMHQPPAWLAKGGQKVFFESIYRPQRFDLCLYGHMHDGRAIAISEAGGQPRCYFQSPSLFGLEHYGLDNEERAFGYSWGSLSAGGEVRVWPLERVMRGGGETAFVHDNTFPESDDGTEICGWRRQRNAVERVDLTVFLECLIDRTAYIDIRGISSQQARGASRHPIERLYTILSSRAPYAPEDLESTHGLRLESVGLAQLLPRYDRLLIEGQPGSGKTTFLRFAACMLARDVLGEPCPAGGSWRQHYLGLKATEAPKIPVLLRLADLAAFLKSKEAPRLRHDNRQWLLDLLAGSCREDGHEVPTEHWQRLLSDGQVLLLLDGLDEAAEEAVRRRVFDIVRDACQHWSCPMVITSRPIDTVPVKEMGFHAVSIEPFGDVEIRAFVEHWVAALHTGADPEHGGEARRYAQSLTGAIVGRSRVKRLAANPVMLTCLCVVHWNEGRLPEGRSRVYRSVLRWLIAARSSQREEESFSDLFAWQALARLALVMMADGEGKRTLLDLEDAAVAVAPLLTRERPDLDDEGRRLEARRWLGFECLGSGIIEEIAGRRLRFWHLTFQEFLAALQLAWRGDGEEQDQDWWPVVGEHLDDAQWRETMELLPGCLLDEGGVGRVDRLLERTLALRGENSELASDARIAGILSRLLRPLEVLGYKPSGEILEVYEAMLSRSTAIFESEWAATVEVETRIAVAEELGRGGDPRLAPGVDNFIEVPGLDGLRLGKYPVTVEDYQRFVEARGYDDSESWDEEGWGLKEKGEWTAPAGWDEQLEHPNRPVTGVSWFEAVAYCRWLSAQRGLKIRLPKEAEWRLAATPDTGEFPWGEDEPDAERANFAPDFGPNVEAPTPVGIYPSGGGPFGHQDLAGNVLEWCLDKCELDKDTWGVSEGNRLRGGGWSDPAEFLRNASSCRVPASYRNYDAGFRVLAAPASP